MWQLLARHKQPVEDVSPVSKTVLRLNPQQHIKRALKFRLLSQSIQLNDTTWQLVCGAAEDAASCRQVEGRLQQMMGPV